MNIAIGFPSYQPVDPRISIARMALARFLAKTDIDWHAIAIYQNPAIDDVMNNIVHRFLELTDCERLLVLDDDVLFYDPKDAVKLIRSKHDVIGGDYPRKIRGAGWVARRKEFGMVDGPLVECHYLACGFSCYSRKAIESVVADAPIYVGDNANPKPGQLIRAPFHVQFKNGQRIGEDVTFFETLAKNGFIPWLDTSIKLGHIGAYAYTAEDQ